MKKDITTLLAAIWCLNGWAQQNFIEANSIKGLINPDGSLFNTLSLTGGFETPKGSGKSTIYTSNIWIGGLNGTTLHLAAQLYGQKGNDFQYGPIANNYKSASFQNTYNRSWSVTRNEVEAHKLTWNNPGYNIPVSISQWPGNGNTTNGEAAQLAPYVDINSNGIYEPQKGDYPQIKGDQAVFFLFNDDKLHTESEASPLKIEIHGMAYAFISPTDTPLNQTVFINYKIFNRSGNNYSEVYFGNFVDFDLGNYGDDFVGCNPKKNMFFAYNGDPNDDESMGGYGNKPPAQGAIFLSHPLSRFVYFNNVNDLTGNPNVPAHFYNYLKGRWKDNSHITYGGTGFGGNTPANFMFPGTNDPLQTTPWDETTAGNTAGDRRALASIGPFNIWSGTNLCIDMALPFAQSDITGNPYNAVIKLENYASRIQQFFNQQQYACDFLSGTDKLNATDKTIKLYPNPATDMVTIEVTNSFETNSLELYNLVGQPVKKMELNAGTNTITINDLSAGVYFYKVSQSNQTIALGKLVKQ